MKNFLLASDIVVLRLYSIIGANIYIYMSYMPKCDA